jgi:predicted acylesterase/phospholipase RssA
MTEVAETTTGRDAEKTRLEREREAQKGITALRDPQSYVGQKPFCDIVMKGGVTSGIVYPLAVCELARQYQFKSVGGTSAGAIAAAATAAAEYGRQHHGGGFVLLSQLPDELAQKPPTGPRQVPTPPLIELFQPEPATRGLFSVALAAMNPGVLGSHLIATLVRRYPLGLIGLLPGLLLLIFSANQPIAAGLLAVICGLLSIPVGFGVMSILLMLRNAFLVLPDNNYGMCGGLTQPHSNKPGLTSWLTDYLDALAGPLKLKHPEDKGRPLTFGDLWDTPDPNGQHNIRFRVMTTNLTLGKPVPIPFETKDLYFHPDELRKLFPARVVDWMVKRARRSDTVDETFKSWGLKAMPNPADLPVVVAARMSLSFPLLISAVKLYSIDRTRKNKADQIPEACWFSDGGLTSNFPVHFFDAPLPRWPTFAINLRPFSWDYPSNPDEFENTWVAYSPTQGKREWWRRFNDNPDANTPPPTPLTRAIDDLTGWYAKRHTTRFLASIWNAAQNWMDNSLVGMPGFRDRIAHVSLDDSEGGLNLKMAPESITRLSVRGWWAARKLWQKFQKRSDPQDPQYLNWDRHRWVRFHNTLSALERWLGRFFVAFDHPANGDTPYPEFIDTQPWPTDPRAFTLSDPPAQDLLKTARWLAEVGKHEARSQALTPQPELQVRPRG